MVEQIKCLVLNYKNLSSESQHLFQQTRGGHGLQHGIDSQEEKHKPTSSRHHCVKCHDESQKCDIRWLEPALVTNLKNSQKLKNSGKHRTFHQPSFIPSPSIHGSLFRGYGYNISSGLCSLSPHFSHSNGVYSQTVSPNRPPSLDCVSYFLKATRQVTHTGESEGMEDTRRTWLTESTKQGSQGFTEAKIASMELSQVCTRCSANMFWLLAWCLV